MATPTETPSLSAGTPGPDEDEGIYEDPVDNERARAARPTSEGGGRTVALAIALVLAGVAASIYGVLAEPERTWPNLLTDGFYFLSLAVGGLFFLASQRLSGARWSAGLRRVPEAVMLMLPVACLLMLVVLLGGRQTLYTWSHPGTFAHDAAIAGRARYLTFDGVLTRQIGCFVIWTFFALMLRRASVAQDRDPATNIARHHGINRWSAAFAIFFPVTYACAAYDWLISLEPEWFSTMFSVFVFAGMFVNGIVVVTLGVILLRRRGRPLEHVAGEEQLHNLGIMVFAFTVFWAYIWTCQYLLIWYGNIPEEVTHYMKRTNGGWVYPFALNFVINWVTPFVVLMSVKAKRTPKVLGTVCVLLLVGHWLDLYMIVMPNFTASPQPGLLEPLIALGYAALGYLLIRRHLGGAALVPPNDPVLAADAIEHARHHAQIHS